MRTPAAQIIWRHVIRTGTGGIAASAVRVGGPARRRSRSVVPQPRNQRVTVGRNDRRELLASFGPVFDYPARRIAFIPLAAGPARCG